VVDLYGRVGSLLEVGTGFHQELTGRENIFLNGAILGMTRGEIRRQFDAIVDFAGVEKFLDTPVKRYSSGMYVRLAFAVAAHLRSEILIVDEVLAVGDAEFQKKCLGKMKEVSSLGRTVLFVSHNMKSVAALCSGAIVLSHGMLQFGGNVHESIGSYLNIPINNAVEADRSRFRRGSGEYRVSWVEPVTGVFRPNEPKRIAFTVERHRNVGNPIQTIAFVYDESGALVCRCDSRVLGVSTLDTPRFSGTLVIRTPWFRCGRYRVDLAIGSHGLVDVFEHACVFQVAPPLPYHTTAPDDSTEAGTVLADFSFDLQSEDEMSESSVNVALSASAGTPLT
jgi:lipopolysaccharide transport system ATP-binding protein